MTQNLYHKYMPGLKQLESEAMRQSPGLALVAVMANQDIERRLSAGKPTAEDIGMLERAMTRAGH